MSWLRIGILCISKVVKAKVGKGKCLFKISFSSQYLYEPYEPYKRDMIIIEYLIVVMVSLWV